MNRFTHQNIVRVNGGLDADSRPECPAGPNFYIVPDQVTAEFRDGPGYTDAWAALIFLEVSGDRYRRLKAGPKHTGPGAFRYGHGNCPPSLSWLVRQMFDAALFSDEDVAKRHAERVEYAKSRKEGT